MNKFNQAIKNLSWKHKEINCNHTHKQEAFSINTQARFKLFKNKQYKVLQLEWRNPLKKYNYSTISMNLALKVR